MKKSMYPKAIVEQEQYTAGQLAVIFSVSHRTACMMIDKGQIVGFTVPGSRERRVLHTAITDYVAANPGYAHILNKIVKPTE